MRFGIGMNTDHTLEEVGLQFSVTKESVYTNRGKSTEKNLNILSRSKQLKVF